MKHCHFRTPVTNVTLADVPFNLQSIKIQRLGLDISHGIEGSLFSLSC